MKQNVFSHIAYLEIKDPCVNSMRNGSYTSRVITGHLFSFNKKNTHCCVF